MTKVEQDAAAAAVEEDAVLSSTDPVVLANAVRFERAKGQVLLDEVIALEDEIVNRVMEENDAVVSPETRAFWREQLLTNRAAATVALADLAKAKGCASEPEAAGAQARRRPLHNRAVSRPVAPAADGSGSVPVAADHGKAAAIRNRAQEISTADRVPFSVAFRRAEMELGGK